MTHFIQPASNNSRTSTMANNSSTAADKMATLGSMQAIHIPSFTTDLSTIRPSIRPIPRFNPSTHILIRVTHVSPTHVDTLYAKGLHQNNKRHAKPPFVLGMDFAGIVEMAPHGASAVTDNNNNNTAKAVWKKGDRVYGSHFGAFAEWLSIPQSASSGMRRVPASWTNAAACAVGASGAISLGSFYRAGHIERGSWVLVTGATGGLGVLAVQVAKALGARVVALAGGEEKAAVLRELGVDAVVSYNDKEWEKEVLKIADGGVAVVYDAVGMVESSLKCCAFGGTVVVVGFAGRGGDVEKVRVNRVLLKGAGVVGYRFGEQSRRFPEQTVRIWQDFDAMVEKRVINPVIYKETYNGLKDIPRALVDLEERRVWGRAVVTVQSEGSSATEKSRI